MAAPFGDLAFLYVGTSDLERDLRYYREVLGAAEVWHYRAFGADVAAVQMGGGPLVLLADHRPAPSVMPIYRVDDLEATARKLRGKGWAPHGDRFEIPNGPCYTFRDPSGNSFAIFEDVRPDAMGPPKADPKRGTSHPP